MGTVLKGLQRVHWRSPGARKTTARDAPALLSKAAWASEETASAAHDELRDFICEPEPVGASSTACKADGLELRFNVFNRRQRTATAQAASAEHGSNDAEQDAWATESQQAVQARRAVPRELLTATDPQDTDAATELVQTIEAEEEQ
ncbi:hypothetical protein ACFWCA_36035 [Streptomyces phaeochromogenes]|uniref:hypothetical protein n=1 Tax=Streptomyces phaeochromogenes TaxID=1923 RepID=UPI0036B57BD6